MSDEYTEQVAQDIGNELLGYIQTALRMGDGLKYDERILLARLLDVLESHETEAFERALMILAAEKLAPDPHDSDPINALELQDCADVARNVGGIPWPACRVNEGNQT